MTPWQALILGVVQGVTEFLPVSSSAHLALTKRLLGLESGEAMIYFDLLCHLGTLLAVLILLRREIWAVLKSPKAMALFTLALLPLIPAYFLLKPLRIALADHFGFFLIATAGLLFLASRRSAGPSRSKWRDVLCIGAAQTLALLPGISRSGSTISAARLLGWEWKEAAKFSFLLAVPTIVGGSAMETLHWMRMEQAVHIPWSVCLSGLLASFFVGLASLRLLFWILHRGTLQPFAWYCLCIGLLSLWMKA